MNHLFSPKFAVRHRCLCQARGFILLAVIAQITYAQAQPGTPATAALPLDATARITFETALRTRAYKQAETILVNEINKNPNSPEAAKLLVQAAGIFFLDNDFMNTAIAYKKAEKIAPLDERHRFTLAMAYLKLKKPDWAGSELTKLVKEFPQNALYLYWLARLDYDTQKYSEAVVKLTKVVALDATMMRAYDNLGLCYEHLSDNEAAIKNYRQAIALNRQQTNPSPWPQVNLALVLLGRNDLGETESLLREALKYDAKLPQAHYQLGVILEKQNKFPEAIQSLNEAAKSDPNYPEPHYTLSRIYQKQGDKINAQKALATFQKLKK